MFGFSLPKLLFTILVVVVVIYGFKALSRLQERRAREVANARARSRTGARAREPVDVEDMVACPVCGTFVAARGARSCGRNDCPYPR
jgi:uncharacterized protein